MCLLGLGKREQAWALFQLLVFQLLVDICLADSLNSESIISHPNHKWGLKAITCIQVGIVKVAYQRFPMFVLSPKPIPLIAVNIHYSCFYKKFDQLGVCAPWGI
jgi:hypothetical protein